MAQVNLSNLYITTAVASKITNLDLRPRQTETVSEPAEMDVLIEKLAKEGRLVVNEPNGCKWRIRTGGEKVIVDYDFGGLWYPLNRGWSFNGELGDPLDQARIILGQIFIGKRTSGYSLIDLDCGFVISDGKPHGHGGNIL